MFSKRIAVTFLVSLSPLVMSNAYSEDLKKIFQDEFKIPVIFVMTANNFVIKNNGINSVVEFDLQNPLTLVVKDRVVRKDYKVSSIKLLKQAFANSKSYHTNYFVQCDKISEPTSIYNLIGKIKANTAMNCNNAILYFNISNVDKVAFKKILFQYPSNLTQNSVKKITFTYGNKIANAVEQMHYTEIQQANLPYDFILTGEQGKFFKDGARMKFEIQNPNSKVYALANLPNSKAALALKDFVTRQWDKSFKKLPPNAVINYNKNKEISVELSNPVLNPKTGSLTFNVKALTGNQAIATMLINGVRILVDDVDVDFRGI